jgi:hypothetical protein
MGSCDGCLLFICPTHGASRAQGEDKPLPVSTAEPEGPPAKGPPALKDQTGYAYAGRSRKGRQVDLSGRRKWINLKPP